MPVIIDKIIANLANKFEVRCFYHLYRLSEIDNPRSGEKGNFSASWYEYFTDFQGSVHEPNECLDRWNFDAVKSYGDKWGDDFKSVKNLIHQLNSLHEVTDLMSDFDPDCVLFLRPDLLYHDKIPTRLIEKAASSPKAEVWIPAWQWFGGLNDRFAICTKSAYVKYGKRGEAIGSFNRDKGPLHAESLLNYQMRQSSVLVKPIFARASRVRIDGSIHRENFGYRTGMDERKTSNSLYFKLLLSHIKSKLGYHDFSDIVDR